MSRYLFLSHFIGESVVKPVKHMISKRNTTKKMSSFFSKSTNGDVAPLNAAGVRGWGGGSRSQKKKLAAREDHFPPPYPIMPATQATLNAYACFHIFTPSWK